MPEHRSRTTTQAIAADDPAARRSSELLRSEPISQPGPTSSELDPDTAVCANAGDNEPWRTVPDACPGCRGRRLHRWGVTTQGRQRWRCRACWKTFTATSGTAVSRLRSPAAFAIVVRDMLEPVPRSCRALARDLAVDRMTIWRWRHKVGSTLAKVGTPSLAEIVETTSVILRESRKASREWVDHARAPHRHPAPNRLRWIDYRLQRLPLPKPMSPFLVPVVLATDRQDDCRATALSPGAAGLASSTMAASAALEPSVHSIATPDVPPATAGKRLATFIAPFRGPATKHLPAYAAWFTARETGAKAGRLAAVWARLSE